MAGHSSIIKMTLATDGREFSISHSGPDFLLLREPASFPAGPAIYNVSIDGEVTSADVNVQELVNSRRVLSADAETVPA
jgi:hypothetical protein